MKSSPINHRTCLKIRSRYPYFELGSKRGLTLLEMILALFIMAIIATTLYEILFSTLKTTTEIRRIQARADEISGFVDSCRDAFGTMPASATVVADEAVGTNGFADFEITIHGAPNAFTFGGGGMIDADKILVTQQVTEGTNVSYKLDLEIVAPTNSLPLSSTPQTNIVPPINLLSGMKNIQWEFWNSTSSNYITNWDTNVSTTARPKLIRLTIQQDDETNPTQAVFWVIGGK